MKVVMEDKFLNKNQCKRLINFYNSQPNKSKKFNTTFPLSITETGPQFLKDKINQAGMDINNAVIDWFEIVKWPSPNEGKALHLDKASASTVLSSIIYLNDNYEGGHTYFEDGTTFIPVTGRAIFFDGQYYHHGVSSISKGPRYTVATWFTHARSN